MANRSESSVAAEIKAYNSMPYKHFVEGKLVSEAKINLSQNENN